ncbi:MAG: hypothetical protein AAF701_03190 [Pseudomonadota bacterium]
MTAQERAEHNRKIDAEIAKLIAETAEIQQNMRYRFWVMGAAYLGALAILLKAF